LNGGILFVIYGGFLFVITGGILLDLAGGFQFIISRLIKLKLKIYPESNRKE